MRRCVGYILRSTVGAVLGEQAQIAACKQLGMILADCVNTFGKVIKLSLALQFVIHQKNFLPCLIVVRLSDYSLDPGVERALGPEAYANAQTSVTILLEISCLARQIGTAVTPLFVEASGCRSL